MANLPHTCAARVRSACNAQEPRAIRSDHRNNKYHKKLISKQGKIRSGGGLRSSAPAACAFPAIRTRFPSACRPSGSRAVRLPVCSSNSLSLRSCARPVLQSVPPYRPSARLSLRPFVRSFIRPFHDLTGRLHSISPSAGSSGCTSRPTAYPILPCVVPDRTFICPCLTPFVQSSACRFVSRFFRSYVGFSGPYVRPEVDQSVSSFRPSLRPPARPSVRPSVRPFDRPSASSSVRPSARPSVRLFDRTSLRPSVRPSTSPSVRLFDRTRPGRDPQ